MTSKPHEFIQKWNAKGASFKDNSFLFADDKARIEKNKRCVHHSFKEFIQSESFCAKRDNKPHMGLLPGPYSGNLAWAEVFLPISF